MNIEKIINDYLEKTLLYKRKGTYEYYKKKTKSLLKILNLIGIKDTEQLQFDSLTKIIKCYKGNTSKKNSQINAETSILYTILKYYKVNNSLPQYEKLPDDTTSYKSLNDNTLSLLFNYLESLDLNEGNNLSWISSIYIMLDTGVRMNEILNIKTKNVDLTSNTIILEKNDTKNGYKRILFFNSLSKKYIEKLVARKNEYLIFNEVKKDRMNKSSLSYFFDKIESYLKLNENRIHAHRLRKTFATRLLKKGCPVTTIQKLLGHTDIKMTMIYLDIDNTMIEKDYFNFYPYEKKEPCD